MNTETPPDLDQYFRSAESWAADREASSRRVLRIALIAAGVMGTIALIEAIAIVTILPLKTVVPYTLLVDRQTGYIQALKPLEREVVAPDKALTRSFLAQYVMARESFDVDSVKDDYRKVALWSAGEARDRYIAGMQANNPSSPLVRFPRNVRITTEIRGISSLGPTTSLVRFVTARSASGGQAFPLQSWQAVINYRFSGANMSAEDRLTNPLGFQVVRYRRDAEIFQDAPAIQSPIPMAGTPVNSAAPNVSQMSARQRP